MLAGPQQHLPPAGAAGQRAGRERRQHARAQQRGLADPRRAEDAHQRPLGQPRDQLGDDPVAAAEELGVRALERGQPLERAHHGRSGARPERTRRLEPGIVVEDHVLELPQLGARGQTQLVAQQRARLAVGGQRVGLPAGAVQGEHQLGAQSLLQRGLRDQPLELDHHLGRVTERKLGVDPLHLGEQAKLLQAPDLGLHPLDGPEVGERGPRHRLSASRSRAEAAAGSSRASSSLPSSISGSNTAASSCSGSSSSR